MKTQKANATAYWIITSLLALGMITGIVDQLFQSPVNGEEVSGMRYPTYLLYVIAIAKITGLVFLLMPGFPLLKEWIYAGFFVLLIDAFITHIASDDSIAYLKPAFLACLTVVSWYLRPANRKMITINCDVHGDLVLISKKQKSHF
jgi:hypothetical protein